MELVPFIAPDFTWVFIVVLIGMGISLIGLVSWEFGSAAVTGIAIGLGGTMFLFGIFSALAVGNNIVQEKMDWNAAVIEKVDDTYGIELSSKEFDGLQFPTEKPDEDFVAYGTISETARVGDAFERRDITLLWVDDELVLAGSVEGEKFVPLEARP